MMSWGELVSLADLIGAPPSAIETVTPMRFATVIRLNTDGKRNAARMRWGLVPDGARDPSERPPLLWRPPSEEECEPEDVFVYAWEPDDDVLAHWTFPDAAAPLSLDPAFSDGALAKDCAFSIGATFSSAHAGAAASATATARTTRALIGVLRVR